MAPSFHSRFAAAQTANADALGLHRTGAKNEAQIGDKQLRRDVSQLIGLMAKQGMVTDRQRLFLLAQVSVALLRPYHATHLVESYV